MMIVHTETWLYTKAAQLKRL